MSHAGKIYFPFIRRRPRTYPLGAIVFSPVFKGLVSRASETAAIPKTARIASLENIMFLVSRLKREGEEQM